MFNRWTMLILPFVLALALVFFNRSSGNAAPILSSLLTPTASSSASPSPSQWPSGPASNKGDEGTTPPLAATSTDSWDVRHTPSVTVAKIRQVLQSYNSPAVDASDAMYKLGVEYGIDPAICLAFFVHESTAGTQGVARITKSVGNIRATAGYDSYQGFRKYDTWEQGIEDWYQLIRDLYIGEWNLVTVDQIVPVYAPAADGNNVDTYISTVKRLVASWRQ